MIFFVVGGEEGGDDVSARIDAIPSVGWMSFIMRDGRWKYEVLDSSFFFPLFFFCAGGVGCE